MGRAEASASRLMQCPHYQGLSELIAHLWHWKGSGSLTQFAGADTADLVHENSTVCQDATYITMYLLMRHYL